jgi:hypothetical protein
LGVSQLLKAYNDLAKMSPCAAIGTWHTLATIP